MNKNLLWFGGAVTVGFLVGLGIGKETRKAGPSHVTTSLDGGVMTIKANVSGAVSEGANNWLKGIFE